MRLSVKQLGGVRLRTAYALVPLRAYVLAKLPATKAADGDGGRCDVSATHQRAASYDRPINKMQMKYLPTSKQHLQAR